VLLIHGSGPGVTAWANWRLVMPALAQSCRVIARTWWASATPSACPVMSIHGTWVAHAIGVLDALGIERTDLVGNSFGGAIALAWPSVIRSGCVAWC
jgi:2-hydroxymuconate-semialdehyde hydrolase